VTVRVVSNTGPFTVKPIAEKYIAFNLSQILMLFLLAVVIVGEKQAESVSVKGKTYSQAERMKRDTQGILCHLLKRYMS